MNTKLDKFLTTNQPKIEEAKTNFVNFITTRDEQERAKLQQSINELLSLASQDGVREVVERKLEDIQWEIYTGKVGK